MILAGRLSELRDKIKDAKKYDGIIQVLKSVLSKKPTQEDFKEVFLKEYLPSREEDEMQFREILMKVCGNFQALDDDDKNKVNEIFLKAANEQFAYHIATTIIKRNGIMIGQDVGNRLDDPVLNVQLDEISSGEDYGKGHPLYKIMTSYTLKKLAEVFVDEISAAKNPDLSVDFLERFPESAGFATMIGEIVSDMIERPESGRMDKKEFVKRSRKEVEEQGNYMTIDFSEGADELARTLEKKDMIKIKGNMIKWKR